MPSWQIEIDDDRCFEIEMLNNDPARCLSGMLKHLRHLPLPFMDELDNPYRINPERTRQHLIESARRLDMELDPSQLDQQGYLNHLHQIYERGYDGRREWMAFHESIHAYELLLLDIVPEVAWLDYREQAGQVQIPITDELLATSVAQVCAGDVFVAYAELGKPPYTYWRDREPDDIDRLCELSRPWTNFKPRIGIALADRNLHPADWQDFLAWFEPRADQYWAGVGVAPRPVEQQQGVLPVGHLTNWPGFRHALIDGHRPVRIRA